jgi:hypothetical protein
VASSFLAFLSDFVFLVFLFAIFLPSLPFATAERYFLPGRITTVKGWGPTYSKTLRREVASSYVFNRMKAAWTKLLGLFICHFLLFYRSRRLLLATYFHWVTASGLVASIFLALCSTLLLLVFFGVIFLVAIFIPFSLIFYRVPDPAPL